MVNENEFEIDRDDIEVGTEMSTEMSTEIGTRGLMHSASTQAVVQFTG